MGDSPAWTTVGDGPFAGWSVERVRAFRARVHELTSVDDERLRRVAERLGGSPD